MAVELKRGLHAVVPKSLDKPTFRVESIEHRLWDNDDESGAYFGDLIIIHVTQISGPEPVET